MEPITPLKKFKQDEKGDRYDIYRRKRLFIINKNTNQARNYNKNLIGKYLVKMHKIAKSN